MTDDPLNESATADGFESELHEGRARFLAHAIEHAFLIGRRSPTDFVRHFPPTAIMEGLKEQAALRARLLAETTGIKHKIAAKKSWQSAAEDLAIALQEGETDPTTIISVFSPDDRVRYLPAVALWSFLTEGNFWTSTPGTTEHQVARKHLAFLLSRALRDGLVSHRSVVEGITVAEVSHRLPKAELGRMIEGALAAGHEKKPFTEVELLGAMPASMLVEHIPLPHLWDRVVVPRIASAHGYLDSQGELPSWSPGPPPPDPSQASQSEQDQGAAPAIAEAESAAAETNAEPNSENPSQPAQTPSERPGGDDWSGVGDSKEAPRSTDRVISEDDFA